MLNFKKVQLGSLLLLSLFISLGISAAPTKTKISVRCSSDGGSIWPAEVTGTLSYGGVSQVQGALTVRHFQGGRVVEEFTSRAVEGLFSDELDYKLLDLRFAKRGRDDPSKLSSVIMQDVSPGNSGIVLKGGDRWATNCLNGILVTEE